MNVGSQSAQSLCNFSFFAVETAMKITSRVMAGGSHVTSALYRKTSATHLHIADKMSVTLRKKKEYNRASMVGSWGDIWTWCPNMIRNVRKHRGHFIAASYHSGMI